MDWKKMSSDLYQRPLGGVEILMVRVIAGEQPPPREPLQIHTILDFTARHSTESVVQAFKDAWKAMRLLKSPDIATTFDGGNKYYKVPSPDELQEWLDTTFIVAESDTSNQEAIQDMHRRPEWLPVLYLLPQTTQDGKFEGSAILFISHWRTEASGSFKILNQIFDYAQDLLEGEATRKALASHVTGSEAQSLTPTLEDILMPNLDSSPEAKARVEKQFAHYYASLPCIDFPLRGSITASPSDCRRNQRIYDSASTSALVKACKARGVTVTSAIHAAYLGVAWSIAEPEKKSRPWAAVFPAQARKRLPESNPLREQGCWNAAQSLILVIPRGDFSTTVQHLREQYSLANKASWLHEDVRAFSEQFMQPPPLQVSTDPVALPYITSFGVIDHDMIRSEHGGVEVKHVAVWADNIGPGIVMGIWTFRGKLNLHISWNIAFHDGSQMQEVLDSVGQILKTELGVEMVTEEVRGVDDRT